MVRDFRLTFFLFVFVSTGCATQHQVFINPSLPIHNSNIGNDIPVSLYVEDIRSSNIIAKWKKGLRNFSISSQNDLKDIFSEKVQLGLKKLGFIPKVSRKTPTRFLKIEILEIKSKYSERVPRMDVWVKAKLRATCKNKANKYSNTYFGKKNRRGITPATFPNENLLNANLSEILGKMLSDSSLLSCLTKYP